MKSFATRAIVKLSRTRARAAAPICARAAAEVATISVNAPAMDAVVASPISQPCCPGTRTPSVFDGAEISTGTSQESASSAAMGDASVCDGISMTSAAA